MAQIILGGLTTLNLATHLDTMNTELYQLRNLYAVTGSNASMSGSLGVGTSITSGARFAIGGGTLPTTDNGFMFSANLAAGRLSSGNTSNSTGFANTYPDTSVIEIAAGTTPGYVSGIVFSSRSAVVNPGTVGIYTYGGLRWQLDSVGNMTPGADNTQTCGSASRRFSTVYAGTGTINTSDAREKTKVAALDKAELAAATDLAREIGAFKYLESVQAKGNDARIHCGMTVQRAIEIMQSHGLTPTEYAFICHDSWPAEQVPARNEQRDTGLKNLANEPIFENIELEPAYTRPAGDRYGFRTDQLAMFIARGQAQRQDELEARIAALEAP